MFAALHFLNQPYQSGALTVNDVAYAYAGNLSEARKTFARRVRDGHSNFIPLDYVNPITGYRAPDRITVTAQPLPGSRMELYPITARTFRDVPSYQPDTENGPVYTLTLSETGDITVTNHQGDYVCNGQYCGNDIEYAPRGWIHAETRSLLTEVCSYIGTNGNRYPARPTSRATREWYERTHPHARPYV